MTRQNQAYLIQQHPTDAQDSTSHAIVLSVRSRSRHFRIFS